MASEPKTDTTLQEDDQADDENGILASDNANDQWKMTTVMACLVYSRGAMVT